MIDIGKKSHPNGNSRHSSGCFHGKANPESMAPMQSRGATVTASRWADCTSQCILIIQLSNPRSVLRMM